MVYLEIIKHMLKTGVAYGLHENHKAHSLVRSGLWFVWKS